MNLPPKARPFSLATACCLVVALLAGQAGLYGCSEQDLRAQDTKAFQLAKSRLVSAVPVVAALAPASSGNATSTTASTVALPDALASLSDSGQVMVRRTGDVFTIQFFLERGLLGQQRSFIYSSNDSTPDEWDGVDAKLAPNWYLSSSD